MRTRRRAWWWMTVRPPQVGSTPPPPGRGEHQPPQPQHAAASSAQHHKTLPMPRQRLPPRAYRKPPGCGPPLQRACRALQSATPPRLVAAGTMPRGATFRCAICMDDLPGAQCSSNGCGHRFCDSCWRGHLGVQIQEGKARHITCMVGAASLQLPPGARLAPKAFFVGAALGRPQGRRWGVGTAAGCPGCELPCCFSCAEAGRGDSCCRAACECIATTASRPPPAGIQVWSGRR